jgi:D-3-phosphoglycerate dehydrogenase / 2-oxoglutarate reductase
MKIAILDDYQDAVRHLPCFELLQGHEVKIFNNGALGMMQLAIRLAPYDVIVLNRQRTTLSGVLLRKLPNLKLIAQTGDIGDHIDLATAAELGIKITTSVGDPSSTAELTWALILAATRKLPQYANHLRQGIWQTASLDPARNNIARNLNGKTLGVWGYGKVGKRVARYGHAFDMRVLVWGSEASRAQAQQDGHEVASCRAEFLSQSDVLSLHLALNESTYYAIGADDFAQMKPDALFVNTSRAALVEPGALESALELGRPGYAAIDVFDKEPVGKEHPMLRPNVLATPHIGYVTRECYEAYYRGAFEAVTNFAQQQAPQA